MKDNQQRVEAIIYPNQNQNFAEDKYFKDKSNTGICFSGGGSRAQVLAMGQLRGLESLGLMENIKYISSVSGGTWASVEYTYRKEDDTKKLIGEYIKPEDITKDILSKNTPKMAQTSVKKKLLGISLGTISPFTFNFILNLCKVTNKEIDTTRQWESVVADTFLRPFKLANDNHKGLFDLNEDSLNEFKKLNPSFKPRGGGIIHLLNKKSPYLIANGIITKPSSVDKLIKPSSSFIGVEFTPLYCEIPYRANDGKTPKYHFSTSFDPMYIGNGAVNSICFGSTPIDKVQNNTISVIQQDDNFGLGAVSGISSYFIGGIMSNTQLIKLLYTQFKVLIEWYFSSDEKGKPVLQDFPQDVFDIKDLILCLGNIRSRYAHLESKEILKRLLEDAEESISKLTTNPVLNCWSPLATPDAIPRSEPFEFSDGGCMDNLGLVPLLRRKVEKVVVFINTEISLSTEVTHFDKVSSYDVDFWLTALFASTDIDNLKPHVALGVDLSHNQVFNKDEFEIVYQALKSKKLKGQAVKTTTKHKVLKNDWWGIDGDYEVEICWVYNEDAKN